MPVAGSFMRVTGKESADVADASAFSLPRIPNMTWDSTENNVFARIV